MSDPVKDVRHIVNFVMGWTDWPVDHQDGDTKPPRRGDLCVGTCATSIFRHDQLNPVAFHKGAVCGFREWATVDNDMCLGKRQRPGGRIDQPEQVAVLRVGRKGLQMHAPHCKHDAHPRPIKCRHRARDVGHPLPIVAGYGPPFRSGQRDQRHTSPGARRNSIAAHLHGERVGCVDHVGDPGIQQVAHKALNPAKATHPLRQGRAQGPLNPPREGYCAPDLARGHRAGEFRRLGRTSEDQKVPGHG